MYGVLLHQMYNYFRVHSGDTFWLKLYVSNPFVPLAIETYAVIQVAFIL